MAKAKKLWYEHHLPKTIDQYVFQNEQQKRQIMNFIHGGEIPHLLFTGTQGSGKTTLSHILVNELGIDEIDLKYVNASEKTGVDYVRDEILEFIGTYPVGKFKVVQLEEMDYMSFNAQGMLRDALGSNTENCRFICTCNYENKIMPPLKSRFTQFRFKAPSKDETLMRMFEILTVEGVEFDPETVDKYVSQAYPDIRKIINNLQLNAHAGKLGEPTQDSEGGDYQFKLLDLLAEGNLRDLRKTVTEQCTAEQLTEVYEFLYRNLEKHPKYAADRKAFEQALCILAEGLYKHALVAIPHLNFEATCIRLINSIGE